MQNIETLTPEYKSHVYAMLDAFFAKSKLQSLMIQKTPDLPGFLFFQSLGTVTNVIVPSPNSWGLNFQ